MMAASGSGPHPHRPSSLSQTHEHSHLLPLPRAQKMSENRALLRSFAYVTQADIVYETSTPREAIAFSALLRLPQEIPREEKLARAERVVSRLKARRLLSLAPMNTIMWAALSVACLFRPDRSQRLQANNNNNNDRDRRLKSAPTR